MNKKKMYFFSVVSFLIIIYLIFLFILYNFQRTLLYHPAENNYEGDKLTVAIEKVKILSIYFFPELKLQELKIMKLKQK